MSFRAICLSTIAAAFVVSVSARALWSSDEAVSPPSSYSDAGGKATPPGSSKSFTGLPDELPSLSDQDPAPVASDDSPLADAMPYVTEGSFFALVGFALGYASRKVVKLLLLLLAGFFVLVQGLSYAEVVSVDWNRAVEVLNDLVLNLKENQTITEVLKDRIPTAGALTTGFALGYRKG